MKLLGCAGLSCEYLQPSVLETQGLEIAGGLCVCRAALERADRRQRLRQAGRLRACPRASLGKAASRLSAVVSFAPRVEG